MREDRTLFHQILIVDDNVNIIPPECTKTVHQFFNNIEYKLWTNKDIRNFISKNFNKSILWCYDCLKPYAFKADLARYCILYKLGGWYSDINNTFIDSPPDITNVDFLFFMDVPSSTGTDYAVSNGLIYSEKGNPVFIHAIKNILNNCTEKYYGPNSLFVTGPAVLGRAVADYMIPSVSHIRGELVADFSENKRAKYKLPDGRIICLNKSNKELPGGEVGVVGTNNYNKFWAALDVYNDLEIYS